MWAYGPTMRRGGDIGQGAIYFSVEVQSRIGTAFQVPVECSVIFGAGFVVELDRFSGHAAASLNCACALVPREWF